MAISKIKLPDNSVQDLHDARGVDINGSFYFVQGSSSAAGSSTEGAYLSVKWEGTVPGVSAAYNGLKIAYRIATRTGVASGGVVLSIDNGAHYYPVVIQKNSMVTTHYPVGATFLAVFNSTQTATAYLTAGTKSTVTGCWQIMEYDSNTNTYQREYKSTDDVEYPITTRYNTTTGESYYTEYGRYSEGVTINPSTNTITASKFKVSGGTSSQFLKADGSVDSTSYGTYSKPPGGIPASDIASGVIPDDKVYVGKVSVTANDSYISDMWTNSTITYGTYDAISAAATAGKKVFVEMTLATQSVPGSTFTCYLDLRELNGIYASFSGSLFGTAYNIILLWNTGDGVICSIKDNGYTFAQSGTGNAVTSLSWGQGINSDTVTVTMGQFATSQEISSTIVIGTLVEDEVEINTE